MVSSFWDIVMVKVFSVRVLCVLHSSRYAYMDHLTRVCEFYVTNQSAGEKCGKIKKEETKK